MPDGNDPLWYIRAEYVKGALQGPWSKPVPADELLVREEGYEYFFTRSETPPLRPFFIDLTGRKVDIHSFRHYYASRMADRVAADKVARITGHRSKAMAELYQAHVTEGIIADMLGESKEAFSNIVQFAKKKEA
jgi:integrase